MPRSTAIARSSPRVVASWDRQDHAARMRRDGASYRDIANALGYADASGAHQAVSASMQRAAADAAGTIRMTELERLDELVAEAVAVLRTDHVLAQAGRVVIDPRTGQPVIDPQPKLAAIEQLRRLSESRRKLVGLDAPARRSVEFITDDLLREALAQHRGELERLQREALAIGVDPARLHPAAIDAVALETEA